MCLDSALETPQDVLVSRPRVAVVAVSVASERDAAMPQGWWMYPEPTTRQGRRLKRRSLIAAVEEGATGRPRSS